jgi:hypothetical protein
MNLIRKPNIKRRLKTIAYNTTIGTTPNKVKRQVKASVNPIYGTNLSGTLKPKKKIYNYIYHRVTIDLLKYLKGER